MRPERKSTRNSRSPTTTSAKTEPETVDETVVFEDVSESDFFYTPVYWAHRNSITVGVDKTHFAPREITTRAQIVTFLWRTADCPEPVSADCGFTDVDTDSYYGKAVQWAAEEGITLGVSDTSFAPDMPVTRAQVVTFLYRFAEGSAPSQMDTVFADVPGDAYYRDAVLWAYENGITVGTSENTFSPDVVCTRGEVVTFLYRQFAQS